MMSKPIEEIKNFVQIDRDGYFNAQGVRVEDDEAGLELFENLKGLTEKRSQWVTSMDDMDAVVEAYDAPYVVQSLKVLNDAVFQITMPYSHTDSFDLSTLTVDEWDRFHGVSQKGIPFVLSEPAQDSFFNLLDEFDDDSVTLNGVRFILPLWLNPHDEYDHSRWGEKYKSKDTPWDCNGPNQALKDTLAQIKMLKNRILVLGCGRGHDAAYLAECGHIVTAVDYSDEALLQAKDLYKNQKNLTFLKADALNLPSEFKEQFDIVFEHTLYCAINPEKRNQLIKSWKRCLVPEGHLLAILFASETPMGPPFGGSEWEIDARLKGDFKFVYWTRWKRSRPKRVGTELVVYAQKKPEL